MFAENSAHIFSFAQTRRGRRPRRPVRYNQICANNMAILHFLNLHHPRYARPPRPRQARCELRRCSKMMISWYRPRCARAAPPRIIAKSRWRICPPRPRACNKAQRISGFPPTSFPPRRAFAPRIKICASPSRPSMCRHRKCR